jgi:hypothetical protein
MTPRNPPLPTNINYTSTIRHRTVNPHKRTRMGMKQTLDVINRMEADGVIGRYAIAGAVAAYNYVEPTVTEDVDILIAFEADPQRAHTAAALASPIRAR